MRGLTIELRESDPRYAPHPRYDTDAGVLVAESAAQRSRVHGIDVDGVLIFDMLASGRLASLELVWPHERWRIANAPARFACVSPRHPPFHTGADRAEDFALAVSVEKDPGGKNLRIPLGQLNADAPVVGLSYRCQALIDGDELLGFLMKPA